MSGSSNGVSRRSLMTATALASLAAMTGCGGGGSSVAAPIPGSPPPPPPPPPPVTSKYLYTANDGASSDAIGAFSIQSSGSLSALPPPINVITNPRWIATHSSGKWLYVSANGNLLCYSVNQTTGNLLIQSTVTAPTPTSNGFNSLEFHPTLDLLYVADGAAGRVETYSVNVATGALTLVFMDSIAGNPNNENPLIKVHPTGKFIYVSYPASARMYAYVLSSSGEATSLVGGSFFASGGMHQPAFNASGTQIYGARGNSLAGYTVNTTTGAFDTSINTNTIAQVSTPKRIVRHPNGRFLFVDDDTQVSTYEIGSSGQLAFVASATTSTSAIPTALAVDYTGTTLYAASSPGAPSDRIEVFTIAANGTLTAASNIASGENPVSIAIANF